VNPLAYLSLAGTVLGINVIPFLMPPTWVILAFFVTKYHLLLLPVVVIGASFATLGRIILATIARKYFIRLLSKEAKDNYAGIGAYLNSHENVTIPLMLTYAFFPIPSNHVFIAAGLARVRIKLLASSFFIGRLISYSFWVSLTRRLSDNLGDIFSSHYSRIGSVVVEIAGLLLLYFIGRIAWKRILKKVKI